MAQVFFIGDLHFGHKRITEFKPEAKVDPPYRTGDNWQENMYHIGDNWNRVVSKRCKVFVLGDSAFNDVGFEFLKSLNGTKVLVRGNHDNYFSTEKWLEIFESVEGIVRYKNYWLTHAPIHPSELRGKKNLHGHVHFNSIKNGYTGEYDTNYINVSCEAINETPISLDKIRDGSYDRERRC
jgi:calcineurin-like phosphoesterase family protein